MEDVMTSRNNKEANEAIEKADWYKYVIVGLLFLGWLLGNIDRGAINFAVVSITKEFQLNASATGLILGSFFAGYAFMQIPGGWLADRFGSRKVILTIVFVWSLFTGLTGVAWGLTSMVIIRFMFGLGEGSFFPSATKMISETFPRKEAGKAVSLLILSGGISGILIPILSAKVMDSIGWRSMFFVIAALGVVIMILYFLFLKPEKVALVKNKASNVRDDKSKVKFSQVFKTPTMWNYAIANFGAYTLIWGLSAWMPSYLVNVKGISLMSAGWLQSLPGIGSMVGILSCGYILDRIKPAKDKYLISGVAVCATALLYGMFSAATVTQVIAAQTVLFMCTGFTVVYLPTKVIKTMPSDIVGSANGFVNFGGQAAGLIAPVIIGLIVDATKGSFSAAFMYLIGIGILMFLSLITVKKEASESL